MVLLYVCPPPLELETDWPIKPYCPSNPSLSSPVHRQLTSLGVSSTLASATGLSTFSADIFAGVTSGVEGRYIDATYYCDSNRLAGEDFPDANKKHPSTVGGRSLRPCAGTWQQREEIRKPHQAVTAKAHHLQKQSNPRCAGGWAPLRLSPPPPPVSLTTSNNGRSGAAKQQPSPKKPTPLRSRPPPPQLPSSALHAKTGTNMGRRKKGVRYIPYTRYRRRRRRKKKGVAEFVVASRGRSVGIGWRGGLEERTNERTLWQQQPQCGHPVVGGGRSLRDPRLGLAWAPK